MSTLKRSPRRAIRFLAITCLALTALPILSSTASAQFRGGRGYDRGGGFYNRGYDRGGGFYNRGYGGFYGNRGFYNGGYGGVYGGRGVYNRGYGSGGYYGAPAYSPFYGGLVPNSLGSPYVAPYVGGGYGGFN